MYEIITKNIKIKNKTFDCILNCFFYGLMNVLIDIYQILINRVVIIKLSNINKN